MPSHIRRVPSALVCLTKVRFCLPLWSSESFVGPFEVQLHEELLVTTGDTYLLTFLRSLFLRVLADLS